MEELLESLGNFKNAIFTNKIIKTDKKVYGLYTDDMKKIAKKMVNDNKLFFLDEIHNSYEEDMIHIFMLTFIKDYNLVKKYLQKTIPIINNWAMCDQLACNLKIVAKHKEDFLLFVQNYKDSKKEYEVRFLLIILMRYYCDMDHINYIFSIIDECYKDYYYIKMAIAWLLCEAMIKFSSLTTSYIKKCKLDNWIINKAISKMNDSTRFSKEEKAFFKTLKRKGDNLDDKIR